MKNQYASIFKILPDYNLFLLFLSLFPFTTKAQEFSSEIELLGVDTQYAYFQYHSEKTAQHFKELLDSAQIKRTVLFHFGASHVQSEVFTTEARTFLSKEFGYSGYGFLFPFSAANTYSSVNYKTEHTGNWSFAKCYQIPPQIPLGARGITIETTDTSAGFSLLFKEPIAADDFELIVFFENNEFTPDFEVKSGGSVFVVNDSVRANWEGKNYVILEMSQSFENLHLNILPCKKQNQLFRFYGFSLERKEKTGFLYQSLGVGASPFEAVLHLEKLKEQASVLNPDIVMLDYGTNNILYKNSVPITIYQSVAEAVALFREINPKIIIILTSTQDLFHKGRFIKAAVEFAQVMDSLAKLHNCMYWNFYDLSGGFAQIKNWQSKGYAQNDHIHLTQSGYRLKGYLLYKSFINTYQHINKNLGDYSFAIPVKNYDDLIEKHLKANQGKNSVVSTSTGRYVIKPGDTLSRISQKFGVSVDKIKRLNNLSSDLIIIGRVLKIK